MIQIVGGKLGAGKTLFCMSRIVDNLRNGKTVVTNIRTYFDEIYKHCATVHRVILEPDQLIYIDPEKDKNWQHKIPLGQDQDFIECYFDEVHLFYNARDWQKTQKENGGLVSFLSQSRKAKVNITFIVQDSDTLERQFRLQAQFELFIASSEHVPIGIFGVLPFKFFIVSKLDARTRTRLNRSFKKYDKRLFKCYDSFSFLDSEMNELSSKANKIGKRKLAKFPLIKYLILTIFPLPYFKNKYLICDSSSSVPDSLPSSDMPFTNSGDQPDHSSQEKEEESLKQSKE